MQASFHITIYKERGTVSMKKYVVIIDLHCDPTIPSGSGDSGGGNAYSRSLLQELQKNNVYHIYITRKKYSYLEEYIQMTSFSEFYRLNLGDWGPIDKDVLQNYHSLSQKLISDILSKYENCTFIFHSSYWQSGMLAYDLAKQYNTFYVHTILSNAKKKKLTGAVDDIAAQRIHEEEKVFQHAKFLICSSMSEMTEMQELYSIPSEKLILAGLKVDSHYQFPAYNTRGEVRTNTLGNILSNQQYFSYFSGINRDDDYLWWNRKNFIYFGRIHTNKGIKEIILAWLQAYEIIGKDMPNLWIVGGAPSQIEQFRNSIKEECPQMDEMERQHRIIWWGTLPPEGISTLLLKSAVLITHSKYEAGGLVLLEALNQGIPVIATANGYGKDYLTNWYNGFIVPYGDIAALKQKLLFFCGQPFLTDYMGANAKQSAEIIGETFDFFASHMMAYGLYPSKKKASFSKQNKDWYQAIKLHSVDTYPYLTEIPSQSDIKKIMQGCIPCTVLNIQEIGKDVLDYRLWEISTNIGTYLFAYYYDLINTTNIWNPYSTEEYVLTKAERIDALTSNLSNSKKASIIYQNTAYGYVIYHGHISNIFSDGKEPINIPWKTDEEESSLLDLKFKELLFLLESPIMSIYRTKPLTNYIQNILKCFSSAEAFVDNLPYASICSLSFDINTDMKIISYDKNGMQYKHLINALREIIYVSDAFCYEKLSLEQLWLIYFDLYKYIEDLLIYNSDSKTELINAIYAQQ